MEHSAQTFSDYNPTVVARWDHTPNGKCPQFVSVSKSQPFQPFGYRRQNRLFRVLNFFQKSSSPTLNAFESKKTLPELFINVRCPRNVSFNPTTGDLRHPRRGLLWPYPAADRHGAEVLRRQRSNFRPPAAWVQYGSEPNGRLVHTEVPFKGGC